MSYILKLTKEEFQRINSGNQYVFPVKSQLAPTSKEVLLSYDNKIVAIGKVSCLFSSLKLKESNPVEIIDMRDTDSLVNEYIEESTLTQDLTRGFENSEEVDFFEYVKMLGIGDEESLLSDTWDYLLCFSKISMAGDAYIRLSDYYDGEDAMKNAKKFADFTCNFKGCHKCKGLNDCVGLFKYSIMNSKTLDDDFRINKGFLKNRYKKTLD